MRALLPRALVALLLAAGAGNAGAAAEPDWSFEGLFGTYDRAAVQRGFQVYREVCGGCHELKYVAFRSLIEIGFTEEEAKAIAAEYEVEDGPNEEGEMFPRPARLADDIPPPFANENAARFANNGALPPNLSLIVKAREGGPDYVYTVLTEYEDPPEDEELSEGLYYNPSFPGGQIAMAPPLDDDLVEFADGTPATVEQMAKDVVTFLAWAAEPKMEERKRIGIKAVLFLLVLTGLFYMSKRKIWSDVP